MSLLDQILVAQFKSVSSVELLKSRILNFSRSGTVGGNATVGCAFEVQSDHLQKIPSEMEGELPYKLLTLSHGLQCPHQLSLPLLTVH